MCVKAQEQDARSKVAACQGLKQLLGLTAQVARDQYRGRIVGVRAGGKRSRANFAERVERAVAVRAYGVGVSLLKPFRQDV